MAKTKVIIYTDIKTKKELCRDTECLFEPHFGDNVKLDSFPLTNTMDAGKLYAVQSREIHNGAMVVFVTDI